MLVVQEQLQHNRPVDQMVEQVLQQEQNLLQQQHQQDQEVFLVELQAVVEEVPILELQEVLVQEMQVLVMVVLEQQTVVQVVVDQELMVHRVMVETVDQVW